MRGMITGLPLDKALKAAGADDQERLIALEEGFVPYVYRCTKESE